MMTQDNCVICKRPLFGKHGNRLTDECYSVCLMRKSANSYSEYSDCGKGRVFLCPDCLKKRNGSSVLGALIKQKEHSDDMKKIQTEGDWICQ